MNWFSILKTSSKEDIFRDLGLDLGFDFLYYEKQLFGKRQASLRTNFQTWGWTIIDSTRTLGALNFMKGIPHVVWKTSGESGAPLNTTIYGEVVILPNITVTTPPIKISKLGYLVEMESYCENTTVEKNGSSIEICVQSSVSTGASSQSMPWGDLLGSFALVYHNNGEGVDELKWLISIAKKEDGSWDELFKIMKHWTYITDGNWKTIRRELTDNLRLIEIRSEDV